MQTIYVLNKRFKFKINSVVCIRWLTEKFLYEPNGLMADSFVCFLFCFVFFVVVVFVLTMFLKTESSCRFLKC